MHYTIKNLNNINEQIKLTVEKFKVNKIPKVIAVSKTFKLETILPLIEYGHLHFGENKVQEAVEKWTEIKLKNNDLKLHLIGRLQTNKVKHAIRLFDFIHSVDNEKLAKKISEEQIKQDKKIKIFIQVNIGDEDQKGGVNLEEAGILYKYCLSLGLDVQGTMCIPPIDQDSLKSFKLLNELNSNLDLDELSMGMSSDFLEATKLNSTFLRIGSSIFGSRG